jgi:hypothetical protein
MTPVFERMSNFIKEKQYSFGYLTLTDFYIAEIAHYIEKIYPETYNQFKFFGNIRKVVE